MPSKLYNIGTIGTTNQDDGIRYSMSSINEVPNNMTTYMRSLDDITFTRVLKSRVINDLTIYAHIEYWIWAFDYQDNSYFEFYVNKLSTALKPLNSTNSVHAMNLHYPSTDQNSLIKWAKICQQMMMLIANNQDTIRAMHIVSENGDGGYNYLSLDVDNFISTYGDITQNTFFRFIQKSGILAGYDCSELPIRISIGLDWFLDNYINKDDDRKKCWTKILAWNCNSSSSVDSSMINTSTKTYTNSTWNTSKTFYIKVSFKPQSTVVNGSNVVNYVTMIRKRNRQLRLSGFVFYFCIYSYIISVRLRYFLLYKEVR